MRRLTPELLAALESWYDSWGGPGECDDLRRAFQNYRNANLPSFPYYSPKYISQIKEPEIRLVKTEDGLLTYEVCEEENIPFDLDIPTIKLDDLDIGDGEDS